MGFPGYNVQSAFCFLKGRSSRFLQLFAVCSETAMSRQDNFSFKKFVYILAVCVLFCWYEMDINFFTLFLLCYGDFFLIFFLVRFLLIFRCTFRRCFSVFVYLLLSSLVLFILGLDLWELFWRAGSYFLSV